MILLILVLAIVLVIILVGCTEKPVADLGVCNENSGTVCGKTMIHCITTPCDPLELTFSNECLAEEAEAFDIQKGEC